ncbi:MAG: helix-turn-helix transcriptional regulator, partial [Candidatus Njordarchaeota archaeon]
MNKIPRRVRSLERRFDQILTILYFGSLRQRELKEIIGISQSWMSELLAEMEKQGLIYREPAGKTNIVKITEKGKKCILRSTRSSIEDIKSLINKMLGQSRTI